MKKKRALLLFGSLGVLSLGYIAWCGRSLYLPVPLPDLSEIPEGYRPAAYALLEQRGFTRRESFSWDLLRRLTADPYGRNHAKITTHWDSTMGQYLVHRTSIASGYSSVSACFPIRTSGITATIMYMDSSGIRYEDVHVTRSPQ